MDGMSTSTKLDRALAILKQNGKLIGTPTISGDRVVFPIDGTSRTFAEIYEMADLVQSKRGVETPDSN